jgi:DNA-binding NarL/FixJ family response regulator
VVVLDLNMPGVTGVQVLRMLVPAFPATRFLVLTMHTDLPNVREAFAAGAHGLVGKDASPAELIDAVWEVARGGRVGEVAAAEQVPPTRAGSGALTARQLEIVQRVAVGMPGKQIASELGISPKTVEFHRGCIARQLGLKSTAALTRYALDRGLVPADALSNPAAPVPASTTDGEPR